MAKADSACTAVDDVQALCWRKGDPAQSFVDAEADLQFFFFFASNYLRSIFPPYRTGMMNVQPVEQVVA